jgi:hypothetical protein
MTLIDAQLLFSFVPKDIFEKYNITFTDLENEDIISVTNWPKNIFYNCDLVDSDDMFYEEFCSDISPSFFVNSVLDRCRSLISRALNNKNKRIDYGPINVYKINERCRSPFMTKARVNIAIRMHDTM